MLTLEPIEHQAMQLLLAGDHPTLETLRQQFDRCSVANRKFTGVGFFTSFQVISLPEHVYQESKQIFQRPNCWIVISLVIWKELDAMLFTKFPPKRLFFPPKGDFFINRSDTVNQVFFASR